MPARALIPADPRNTSRTAPSAGTWTANRDGSQRTACAPPRPSEPGRSLEHRPQRRAGPSRRGLSCRLEEPPPHSSGRRRPPRRGRGRHDSVVTMAGSRGAHALLGARRPDAVRQLAPQGSRRSDPPVDRPGGPHTCRDAPCFHAHWRDVTCGYFARWQSDGIYAQLNGLPRASRRASNVTPRRA